MSSAGVESPKPNPFYHYYSNCDPNLKRDLDLLNLPQCSELYTCFCDEMKMLQSPSLDFKILIIVFLKIVPVLRLIENEHLIQLVSKMLS